MQISWPYPKRKILALIKNCINNTNINWIFLNQSRKSCTNIYPSFCPIFISTSSQKKGPKTCQHMSTTARHDDHKTTTHKRNLPSTSTCYFVLLDKKTLVVIIEHVFHFNQIWFRSFYFQTSSVSSLIRRTTLDMLCISYSWFWTHTIGTQVKGTFISECGLEIFCGAENVFKILSSTFLRH